MGYLYEACDQISVSVSVQYNVIRLFQIMSIPITLRVIRIMKSEMLGRLLDALNIKSHESVLEIGTGSGYLTTVVAKLCQSSNIVETTPRANL
jgi:protein-L-isoaspartate O-methyltransferase